MPHQQNRKIAHTLQASDKKPFAAAQQLLSNCH